MTIEEECCFRSVLAFLLAELAARRVDRQAQADLSTLTFPLNGTVTPPQDKQAEGSQPPVVRGKGLEFSRTTGGDSPGPTRLWRRDRVTQAAGGAARAGGEDIWVPSAAHPDGGVMHSMVNDQVPAVVRAAIA